MLHAYFFSELSQQLVPMTFSILVKKGLFLLFFPKRFYSLEQNISRFFHILVHKSPQFPLAINERELDY